MREIKFRVWYDPERKMYFRGYQKWFYVLLCDDDKGANEGRGLPVKRAKYEDCTLLEATGIMDKHGREIYEGDRLRIKTSNAFFEDRVDPVPDMFRSRKLHPLQELLNRHHISNETELLEIEIVGTIYA